MDEISELKILIADILKKVQELDDLAHRMRVSSLREISKDKK